MTAKDAAAAAITANAERVVALCRAVHANPELAFEEHTSSQLVADELRAAGFAVEMGTCDLPTAFVASAGTGSLHVAVCAEYDALPEVGHACGHNVIAAAAVAAGIGLAAVAEELDLTVSVLGTPAEEGGGGKVLMLERGAFDGVHAAMMVHPYPLEVIEPRCLAITELHITYSGVASHAAAFPERGVNAADALTVAQVAIGLLRQHISSTARVHGIVTKGGDAPNIVPSLTQARYFVRAATLDELNELLPRVVNCFEAGATATGATLDIARPTPPYSHMESDADLVRLYRDNLSSLGRPLGDVNDPRSNALFSTDMANVSLAIPSIHPMIDIDAGTAGNHQPEFAARCASAAADKAAVEGGIAMAWTAIDAAADPDVRGRLMKQAFSHERA